MSAPETYNAGSIGVLKGLEAVRLRPAMYIGDVLAKGLHHLVYEVVDNSIDEALAGFASTVDVTIHENNAVTVVDNGRGIPVDMHPTEGRSALEVVMTVLHAGGKFNKDTYQVSGGLHGVGVSCVNALSSTLIATVFREGKVHEQTYHEGIPEGEVRQVGTTDLRGTQIYFEPDPTIFLHTTVYNYNTLANRLRELSFLNKGITITLTDMRTVVDGEAEPRRETFHSDGGLREFVKYLDANRKPLLPEPIYVLSEGKDVPTPVEVAMQYNDEYSEHVHSYVNNINTIEHGTHVFGFRRALTRALKTYFEGAGMLQKLKFDLQPEDYREGLTVIVSVKVQNPQFEGQTKGKLGNSDVESAVYAAVMPVLTGFLEEHPREARVIFEKVSRAAEAREAANKARKMVQRKGVLGSHSLPGKLADCASNKPEECEIYLVEGDSAGGTAKQGRDRAFQAIMPLRGKILNVEKAIASRVFDNEEIRNVYTALGVFVQPSEEGGDTLNIDKIRYHRVIIMTDADVDGSHITTLILTFFFRYMRSLIEAGYIYIATPPLYLVRKGKEERYCWNEVDRKAAVEELGKGKDDAVGIQRYKGLGEMNAEQLWSTTMNPETRTLRQVSIESAAEADRIFSMLMGDDVPPRREFIEENASYANIDA